jgi:hypothetical protein
VVLFKFNIFRRPLLLMTDYDNNLMNFCFIWVGASYEKLTFVFKVKGKAIRVQAWTSPEGSRRFRPPDFQRIGT